MKLEAEEIWMKATYCKGHTRVHSSLIKIRLGTGDSSVNRYPQPHEWLISSNFQDLSTGRCEVLGAKRRRTAIVLHCCPTGSNNNNGAGTVGRCHSSTKVSWLESKEQPRKVAVEDKVGHADGKYEKYGALFWQKAYDMPQHALQISIVQQNTHTITYCSEFQFRNTAFVFQTDAALIVNNKSLMVHICLCSLQPSDTQKQVQSLGRATTEWLYLTRPQEYSKWYNMYGGASHIVDTYGNEM